MSLDTLTVTTSVAGLTAAIAAYSVVAEWIFRKHGRINQRLKDEFDGDGPLRDASASLFKRLSIEPVEAGRSFAARLQQLVEQSGLAISAARLMEVAVVTALLAGVAMLAFVSSWIVAIPAAATGFAAPLLFVQWKRRQRIQQLSKQLPGAFELMSRAVRAGQTMPAAFRLVASESKPPISAEFSLCCEQQDLGLPLDVTLRELARRNGVMELQMFVVALLIQRQAGGSPVELLNNLSQMVRKRIRMKGKVQALTGEGRLQAIVLSILPLLAFAAIYFLKRSYAQVLLDRPLLLAGMVLSGVIGSLWIRKIVNFEY